MHIAGITAEAPAGEGVLWLTAASCSFYEKRRDTHTHTHVHLITDNRLPTRALYGYRYISVPEIQILIRVVAMAVDIE